MTYPNLIAEMARIKVNKPQIAALIKVSLSSLYHKLDSRSFTWDECTLIHDVFFPNTELNYLFAKEEKTTS